MFLVNVLRFEQNTINIALNSCVYEGLRIDFFSTPDMAKFSLTVGVIVMGEVLVI
jgi:hypothetical protein